MKKSLWAIIIVIIIAVIAVYFLSRGTGEDALTSPPPEAPTVTPPPPVTASTTEKTVLGMSAGEREISAYTFGDMSAEKEILFVGGIHGGYEWNTSVLAYEAMDYFRKNTSAIPSGIKVTVIPVLNPDGLSKVISDAGPFTAEDVTASQATQVAGRYNGNGVDLNRNFDCDWQAKGMWQDKEVSGGTKAFSEPETQAIKDYIENHKPTAVVMWTSSGGGVFSSNCHQGIVPETKTIMQLYADAAHYPAHETFDFYKITGDMTNWLAKNNIPAIGILLTTHTDSEWTKNKAGIDALLKHFAQ